MLKVKEYKVEYIHLSDESLEDKLNETLRKGWILDSFAINTPGVIIAVFFKV